MLLGEWRGAFPGMLLVSGGNCAVLVGSGLVGAPAGPEVFLRLRVAEGVGSQLQDRVGVVVSSEFFRSFHPGIDLLDR